jgi:hypothetical protein
MSGRRQRLVIAAVMTAVLAVALILWRSSREPVYQGKPLSYWSEQARHGDRPTALEAVRAGGPNAASFFLHELRRQNSVSVRLRRQIWPFLPKVVKPWIPEPPLKDQFLFVWTGRLLAVAGSEPHVLKGLNDVDPDVRLAATWAVQRLGSTRGSELVANRVASLLADPVPEVRVSAALALGTISSNRLEIVPVLMEGLTNQGLRQPVAANLRQSAPHVLSRLGTNVQTAAPELRNLLGRPVSVGRAPVSVALSRTAPETNAAVYRLVSQLQRVLRNPRSEDPWTCDAILNALAELGPGATAATT